MFTCIERYRDYGREFLLQRLFLDHSYPKTFRLKVHQDFQKSHRGFLLTGHRTHRHNSTSDLLHVLIFFRRFEIAC